MTTEARKATAESAQRRMAIEYMRFDGFDEHSPTLEQSPAVGTCMRSWWDVRRWPTVIKDPAVACRSGDLVQLLERGRDGRYRTMIKELRCTRDRKWWAVCDDGVFQIGALYRPSAMTRVVALSTRDWGLNLDAPVTGASPAELAQLNALAGTVRAVAEWKEHGFERGVAFPGLYLVNIPDPARTDLPTTRDDPRNGLGVIAPAQLTLSTPSYDRPIAPTNLTASGIVKGVLLKWQAPQPRHSRQIYHIYQHTANTPFASASRVWSGNALETTIDLATGVTRFFWVTGELNGIETSSVPSGNGVTGTPATANTEDITDDAATEVESFEDSSSSLINGGGNALGGGAALTPLGINYLLQVTATLDIWITNTGGGTPEFFIEVSGGGGLHEFSQSVFPTVTTSPGQRITLQCEVPITPANEGGGGLFAGVSWTGAQPAGTAEMRNGAIRFEKLKR